LPRGRSISTNICDKRPLTTTTTIHEVNDNEYDDTANTNNKEATSKEGTHLRQHRAQNTVVSVPRLRQSTPRTRNLELHDSYLIYYGFQSVDSGASKAVWTQSAAVFDVSL
jgi:hypothetical protein